jgi:two-component system sensor histidine kinase YesM
MHNNQPKSFASQLKKSFLLVVMIPILFLGSFVFFMAFRTVDGQRQENYHNLVNQCQITLSGWVEQCNNSINYAAANYTLQQFLAMDKNDSLEVNRQSKNVSAFLYNVMLSNQSFDRIQIYSRKDFDTLDGLVTDISEVKTEQWYQKLTATPDIIWWYQDGFLYAGKRIASSYPKDVLGVVSVRIKTDALIANFQILSDAPVTATVGNGADTFVTYVSPSDTEGRQENPTICALSDTGLVLEYRIRTSYFQQNLFTYMLIPILFILAALSVTWFMIRFSVSYLERDLGVLVKQIQVVQNGNFNIRIVPSHTIELNVLGNNIQILLDKINQLIERVYSQTIERQKMELELLQTKINPHFLYNSLSAINWLAIDSGQDKISEITTNLAAFYRTALNKGRTIGRAETEADNIKAYLSLQKIVRDDDFDVVFDLSKTTLQCTIPLFIMQPLVENAVMHGIASIESGRRQISIRMWGSGKHISMTVHDNGTQLYQKIGSRSLPQDQYGFGTSNVNKRIKLICGDQYGLTVYADETGTTSEINLCEVWENRES